VDRCIADLTARQSREVERLIMDGTIDVEERDLLQADDVRLEIVDQPGDALQSITPDVPPPGGRERLPGADRRPDVPGRDAEGGR
jgi:hypothetical protein